MYGPIEQYQQIIVLPEEIARKVDNKKYYAGGEGYITQADAKKYGTIYDVEITAKTAETEALLKTFKVGNTTLTIDGNTIKGELPYSATEETHDATKAVYAEYTLSKYALLHVTGNTGATFVSKGDENGNGKADDTMSGTNRGFIFVRSTTVPN